QLAAQAVDRGAQGAEADAPPRRAGGLRARRYSVGEERGHQVGVRIGGQAAVARASRDHLPVDAGAVVLDGDQDAVAIAADGDADRGAFGLALGDALLAGVHAV